MIIKFTNVLDVPEEYAPVPASKLVPDWYKNLDSYMGGDKKPNGEAGTTATAKRCMPIFDSLSAGYLILTHTDIFVSQKINEEGNPYIHYEWPSFSAIEFHPKEQLPDYPGDTGHKIAYPKWRNTWSISTPPGYSTLFVPPIHRESPIIPLVGMVDTDTYTAPVNFPFVLKDPTMEGLIPAGTPIVQVIPIKRDEWTMEIGKNEDLLNQQKVSLKLRTRFFDSYKNQFRSPKSYK